MMDKLADNGLAHDVTERARFAIRRFSLFNGLQGGLEIVVALAVFIVGLYVPAYLELLDWIDQFDGTDSTYRGSANPLTGPHGFWALVICGLALLVFAGGCLRIVAARKNRKFRGRPLGIASLCMGMSSIVTVICAPTALALLIWGLIIYVNPSVKAAFKEGDLD